MGRQDHSDRQAPALFVTNLHRNFTGVSATAAAVVSGQAGSIPLRLVGEALPGCPPPIVLREAFRLSRNAPPGKPFSIWHVRRNKEMRTALFARDVLRLPVRIVFTSAAQRRHSAFPRWLISRMDAVIATSPEAATFVPNVRAVVPHGVDTKRFCPPADRAAAWKATGHPGDYGIATVGRIRPEKGTDRFVDTMIEALPQLPGATALVIGKAAPEHRDFLKALRDKVTAAGLADRLLFPGEVPNEAMPGLMRSLSLLVALPRYEGYGVTPLEAMACGVPFVASDAGAYREFSGSGTCGTIVREGDASGAIVAILSNADTLNTMSKAARDRAQACFSVETEIEGINTVYKKLWSGTWK